MRQIDLLYLLATLAFGLLASDAHAQGVLYRCESADGISIQGTPCPKNSAQRKLSVQRPAESAPPVAPIAVPAVTTLPPASIPLTSASAMRGPTDPYPLWQCMRADGSTFDSRDGRAGKQWVVKPGDDATAGAASAPAQIIANPKAPIVRPFEESTVATDEPLPDPTPPPAGAAPGQWVADQCTQLEPQQACERFATRRDALRKQIYAAKPSERANYAPEEQDLTAMLFAACRR